ncbi:MAG: hypothetical protein VX293_07500 [Candidatus Latescibacterota bacterium]|nr:hypothetical protein [Candidatus Latescibacterota bacterium]
MWHSWGIGLCALALACAPPPVSREGWRATEGPAALLALAVDPLRDFEDLTVEAAIELRQGEVRERGTALIQLVNPHLFRVEVRGPFFTHIFTALLEGDSLTVYGRAVDPPLKGVAHGHLLAALTGLDLGQLDLRYALLGFVEPGPVTGPVEYPRADRAVVPLGGGRRVWLDLQRGFVRSEAVAVPGGDSLRRELEKYQRLGELYLPQRVKIRQRDVSLALEYKSYAFNRGLDAGQLQRGIPQNVLRVP